MPDEGFTWRPFFIEQVETVVHGAGLVAEAVKKSVFHGVHNERLAEGLLLALSGCVVWPWG